MLKSAGYILFHILGWEPTLQLLANPSAYHYNYYYFPLIIFAERWVRELSKSLNLRRDTLQT